MRFDAIAALVGDVPIMTPAQGRVIYDHLVRTGARQVLELGTAHGTSAAYMAAAVDELGGGMVTTLEREGHRYEPEPADVLARAPALRDQVTMLRLPHSSYVWWLQEQVRERSDAAGNVEPLYDFCYLDGAHLFTVDGLAVVLVEKLLKPGGWLLLDDLNWTYAGTDIDTTDLRLSEDERRAPHMRAVFDVIVRQHPSFTQLREQDGSWGWAQKAPGQPRRLELQVSRSPAALVVDRLKRAAMQARARRSA